MEREPKCPECGYTAEDAAIHLDHRLCRNDGNAPWQEKPLRAEQVEANKMELLRMLSNAKQDAADLVAFRALAKEAAESFGTDTLRAETGAEDLCMRLAAHHKEPAT